MSASDSSTDTAGSETNRSKTILKWVGAFAVLAVVIYLFEVYELRATFSQWFKEDVKVWLAAHPVKAPFVYIALYVVAVVAFMPGSVITLAGGALFGWLLGTIYVSIASTTAAGIAFLIARYLAADWIERKASGKLNKIKKGIEEEGARFVAFTRLVPIFPYNLLNYMFGLTKIDFWTYLGLTWLCMLPGTFAYVYAGFAGRKLFAGGMGMLETIIVIAVAVGLLVFASMIPKFVKMFTEEDVEEIIEEDHDNSDQASEGDDSDES